jgi:hypothetical protein
MDIKKTLSISERPDVVVCFDFFTILFRVASALYTLFKVSATIPSYITRSHKYIITFVHIRGYLMVTSSRIFNFHSLITEEETTFVWELVKVSNTETTSST